MGSREPKRTLETEAKGGLEPPTGRPPTVGTGTPDPDDEPGKTIVVGELTTVEDLARLIDVPPTRIIGAAFQRLGWMITTHESLAFDRTRALAGQFGYEARRDRE